MRERTHMILMGEIRQSERERGNREYRREIKRRERR